MPIEFARYDKDTAFDAVCAATIAAGQLVGLDSSFNLVLADADAGTPIPAVGVALTAGVSGGTIGVARDGVFIDSSLSLSMGELYLSGTAGGVTATKPNTNGNCVQHVGFALSATKVAFRIGVPLKYQTSGNSVCTFL